MSTRRPRDPEGQLYEWGARLFWGQLRKKSAGDDSVAAGALPRAQRTPSAIRAHIRALVSPGGKQVMVKITGGGRGMKPIQAHMRYISRLGKAQAGGRGQTLELEDEQGNVLQGKQALRDLADDWRLAGSYIAEESRRREAFNIILSMPEGTPPEAVKDAARAFAQEEFEGHKWVMVLHTDTHSPHVHLAVRSERGDGRRLNPRKADLQRWRERFASRLQDRGVNALATPARVRGVNRSAQPLWRVKAGPRARSAKSTERSGPAHARTQVEALQAWAKIREALNASGNEGDRRLARDVDGFMRSAFDAVRTDPANHRGRAGRDR